MVFGLIELGLAVVCAVLVTTFCGCIAWSLSRKQKTRTQPFKSQPIAFLAEGQIITDTSAHAALLLKRAGLCDSHFDELINALTPLFPTLRDAIKDTQSQLKECENGTILAIKRDGNTVHLTLSNDLLGPTEIIDAICENQRDRALSQLHFAVEKVPSMMWQTDRDGNHIWGNPAYLSYAGDDVNLPVFDNIGQDFCDPDAPIRRAVQQTQCTQAKWFDITASEMGDAFFYHATDVTQIVNAELTQRNFVQTLSQTFAQLAIGLAIFDRKRQLATFNPALLDMTNLAFDFLSNKPTLDTVFDHLRESRMLPEPKDYTTWREQFTAMEQAAKDGSYCENWNLPDGQTFRVTGRPHPDGAFALLFEDISAEISLTRRFRLEIETSQAVLDHFSDAVAVFSNSGNLVLVNAAYCALWGTDLTKDLLQYDLRDELQKWQDRCTPSRIWSNLRTLNKQREPWTDTAILDDGRHISCLANPISGGMTLIRFRFDKPSRPVIQKITQADTALLTAKG